MHFEGITLAVVTSELRSAVRGAFVQQIHQPLPELILLKLYRPREKEKLQLLISAGGDARAHLTEQRYENPLQAPTFSMLLRKHLKGGVLEEIGQPDLERILDLVIAHREGRYTLRAELMGNRSNVVLLQGDRIMGALKPTVGSRVFAPHTHYEPPSPQERLDPRSATPEAWQEALRAHGEDEIRKALAKVTAGIGPRTAGEIVARVGLDPQRSVSSLSEVELDMLWEATSGLFQVSNSDQARPHVYIDDAKIVDVTPDAYVIYRDHEAQEFETISEALDACHRARRQEPFEQLTHKLSRALRGHIRKVERALVHVEKDLGRAKKYSELKELGDLLIANLSRIQKGQTEIEVEDFYHGGNRVIALDPRLEPSENAQRYYARYKKGKRAVEKLAVRRRELELELRYLGDLEMHLEQAETLDELRTLEEEFIAEGFLRAPKRPSRPPKGTGPRRFELEGGWTILVGHSGRENDRLVRAAHPEDVWLHARDRPGAHVIVAGPRKGELPPEPVLLRAAELAAYYSRGRGSAKVSVTYTRVKHLRRPNGARPGLVLVPREEGTLTVAPKGDEGGR
jgi:predicted ribosome quality control (RQC) complex YloA/Tae2 family protein